MSSHATEGARPSAAPAGEAPTAAEASVAPAEAVPVGAAPAEEDAAQGTAVEEAAQDAAAEGAAVEEAAQDAAAEGAAADEAAQGAAAEGAAAEVTGDGLTEPGFTGDGSAESDFTENEAQPVSKLAIAALLTGLVALVPVAVACGAAALAGIRRTGRRGHGMAMAGLFLAAAWVIIAAAIGTVGLLTHGFHKPVTVKYREAAVFMLREGDCVDSPNGKLVSVLPCTIPHEAEVFATFALPASRWPGTAAIAGEASSGCGSRLDSYLNPQLAISLSQSFVYPDKVAWTAGTRTVICEVRASSGQLTGSVRGATLAEQPASP